MPLNAYTQDIKQKIGFVLSNDKFADNDKYFTNGIYLNYSKLLPKSFILTKKEDTKLQLSLSLGNEIYSPENLSSTKSSDFDRPYAGWLFGTFQIGSINKNIANFISLETGITGPESYAGKLQVAIHNTFDIAPIPTWTDEIAYKWLFNFKTKHIFNILATTKNALHYSISPSLGTKDIYVENNISYYFGKLNTFQNSSRVTMVDNSAAKEIFGYLAIGHTYVAHNTLIEGAIYSSNDPYTIAASKNVLRVEIGAVLHAKKNTFKIYYNYNSKETDIATSHVYGSLAYSRSF